MLFPRFKALSTFIYLALLLTLASNEGFAQTPAPAGAQSQAPIDPSKDMNRVLWTSNSNPAHNFEEVLDRAINSEHVLVDKLRAKEPVIETYIQEVKKDPDLGFIPTHDFYFLGKLNITSGVVDDSFLPQPSTIKRLPHVFTSLFTTQYYPRGFADEMFLDSTAFDRAHYDFEYVRREFLGDVRCFVVDLIPKKGSGKGRFEGRMWIEDHNYNIVRFNGRYVPSPNNEYSHFESWRVNAGGMWLPTYIYAQEEGYRFGPVRTSPMRAQTRLWDYETSKDRAEEAFTELTVDSPNVKDQSQATPNGYSPVQSQRSWEEQAEENVVDRLQKAGLVAPRGDVDQVLDTVLNNLEVTNNINLDPPVHARILLTTPLESVAVNHVILISRGLVDVLPDEASLAAVLAHELAHVVLAHSMDTRYSFADRLLFDDPEALKRINIARTRVEEDQADKQAILILKNSPYKDKLPRIGLFLRMLSTRSDDVPHLIKPLLGNRMSDTKKDLRMSGLMDQAPELAMRDKNQISALPLGSRVVVDPWSDQLKLLKNPNMTLASAKEKLPFQVTPFMVFLTRENPNSNSAPAAGPSAENNTVPQAEPHN
ncbi:MAG TPA: M48 family metalloprotease [Bryobacteraceae bacterium]|jgi:hypothetical protein|nr:M48 family metalloprotease [Bryobacteraceae bacterium]